MNYRNVFHQFGSLLLVLSLFLLLIASWGLARHWLGLPVHLEAMGALFVSGGIGGVFGAALFLFTRKRDLHLGRREALLLVAFSWIGGAVLAALPYFIWAHWPVAVPDHAPPDHPFRNFVDCYFETMSGLTTTGATVLSDIEAMPQSLLLWRSMTHWLGGIGIVVLFVAVLPTLGVGGKKLFRVEAPGPAPEGLQPQIRETARVLVIIYLSLTIVQSLLFWSAGMTLFDAVCHTMATLATGGFSTNNASMGAYYASPAIDWITIVFMIVAGMNFGLFYQMFRRRFDLVWRDAELRLYLIIIAVASTLIVIALTNSPEPLAITNGVIAESDFGASVRQGLFTTAAIQTTTGFCTSDFNLWPFLAQSTLVMLMFIGGSAGSTAGGFKVIRLLLVFKIMLNEIEKVFRPNVIRPVKVGRNAIAPELVHGTLAYVLGFVILFVVGAGAIMLIEEANTATHCTFQTASTASIATLCTIGPGLGQVGAVENYGWFSDASKIVMTILMACGRLEVFAIIVLFSPRFWRGH